MDLNDVKGELDITIQALRAFEISLHALIKSGEPLDGIDYVVHVITDKLEIVANQIDRSNR